MPESVSIIPQKWQSEPSNPEDILVWIKDRIRTNYEAEKNTSAETAIREIASVWEQLDKTAQLAEAKTRILLGKIEKPQLAPLPEWFEEQLAELHEADEELAAAHPVAIESAQLLVRACLHAVPEAAGLDAEVSRSPLGGVLIDWNVAPHILQWIIQPVELPWPGVKVHVLSVESGKTGHAPVTRTFYNAFDLVDHFREQLQRCQQTAN